jgi:hypothetical protein
MRRLFSAIFSLVLSASLAAMGGDIFKLCACKCGQVEDFCPCGHPIGDQDLPSSPMAPADAACTSHLPSGLILAAGSNASEAQSKIKPKPALDIGKSLGNPAYLFEARWLSAVRPPAVVRAGPLVGLPAMGWLGHIEKTGARLAALSFLRI